MSVGDKDFDFKPTAIILALMLAALIIPFTTHILCDVGGAEVAVCRKLWKCFNR